MWIDSWISHLGMCVGMIYAVGLLAFKSVVRVPSNQTVLFRLAFVCLCP